MLRFFLLSLLLFATTDALAQSAPPPTPTATPALRGTVAGAVMIVRQVNHARAALKTAASLRQQDRFATVPIELVVCGAGSEHLLGVSADAAELVAEAERTGVRLLACGMSLGNLGIDPAALAEGVEIVPNGLLHALERQADGFVSVEL